MDTLDNAFQPAAIPDCSALVPKLNPNVWMPVTNAIGEFVEVPGLSLFGTAAFLDDRSPTGVQSLSFYRNVEKHSHSTSSTDNEVTLKEWPFLIYSSIDQLVEHLAMFAL